MTSRRPTVVLAVSGHGYGHAVRCAELASALLQRGARVLIRSDAPAWLFPPTAEHVPSPSWPLDIGVAQRDGLELDIDETRRRWQAFAHTFAEHADHEARLLQQHAADVLVADVPPLALAAAARAGIPGLALTNFGWDWIYAVWPDFEPIVACVQAAYRQAEMLLRLPLHSTDPEAFSAFRAIQDVPLIARYASRPRAAVRAELGVALDQPLALLSFGAFDARGLDLGPLGALANWRFVATPPLSTSRQRSPANVLALAEAPADYVSLLAACDVVVTKPGYGIVADCLANHVQVLYTDRGPFREYHVLAAALDASGQAGYIPRPDLLAGRLGPYLDALARRPAHWKQQPRCGAATIADTVLARAHARAAKDR